MKIVIDSNTITWYNSVLERNCKRLNEPFKLSSEQQTSIVLGVKLSHPNRGNGLGKRVAT